MSRKRFVGQAETVAVMVLAVILSIMLMLITRYVILVKQAAAAVQQEYIRYSQALEEYIAFNLTNDAIYANPNIAVRVVYATILLSNTSGEYQPWRNNTEVSLEPGKWTLIYSDKWSGQGLAKEVDKCKARIYIVTKRGRIFGWCPTYLRFYMYNSTIIERGFLLPTGFYKVYLAKSRPQQIVVKNYVISTSMTVNLDSYNNIWYIDTWVNLKQLIILPPIVVFYYGPLNISDYSYTNSGKLYTNITIKNIATNAKYSIVIDDSGNIVSQSGFKKESSNVYIMIPEINLVFKTIIYELDGGEFLVASFKLEHSRYGQINQLYDFTYYDLKLVLYPSNVDTIVNSLQDRVYGAYSCRYPFGWNPKPVASSVLLSYGADLEDICKNPYSWLSPGSKGYITLVLINSNTWVGTGTTIPIATIAITNSRTIAGYFYNINPPATVTASDGTNQQINTATFNLGRNLGSNYWIKISKTLNIAKNNVDIAYQHDLATSRSLPAAPNTATPTPLPSSLMQIPVIRYEQKPIPNTNKPITTTITLWLENPSRDFIQNSKIVYKVMDDRGNTLESKTTYFTWDPEKRIWDAIFTLSEESKKMITIWIYYKEIMISTATFYNYLSQ
ncbi:hypothetical protein QPL79_02490 [Ignisphaera sp. 4213-co]|uniref:Uncharacterized protein n=1 Tax=Ignisphaera cupida TaxID=3050454 RepID=A0ABD4Z6I6_9CREN|nr:hypothetical protein [Ignisphaera sp. 4213-co]MDK6028233.1 hypothetical protein [Ignisphaera sp. 4213-co]